MFFELVSVLMCAAASYAPQAAPVEQPLTNADILNMLKARLPENSIALAIEVAGLRGNTNFDASPSALVELKNQGATEKILDAVITAPKYRPPYRPSHVVPDLPELRGLYFRTAAGWTRLPSLLMLPEIAMGWGLRALDERRYVVPGGSARLRIVERLPVFHLRDPSPERDWALLRLVAKKDRREARAQISGMFSAIRRLSFETGVLLPLQLSAPAPDVLELRPVAELEPGEYLIIKLVPGQQSVFVIYEFGIGERPNNPS
jgi:hypothetical protein